MMKKTSRWIDFSQSNRRNVLTKHKSVIFNLRNFSLVEESESEREEPANLLRYQSFSFFLSSRKRRGKNPREILNRGSFFNGYTARELQYFFVAIFLWILTGFKWAACPGFACTLLKRKYTTEALAEGKKTLWLRLNFKTENGGFYRRNIALYLHWKNACINY